MNTECGWAGQILFVNLSSGKHSTRETTGYLPGYLGGRGLAAKIAWDRLEPGVDGYDENNLLMFMTGPLGGTFAPSAGRGYVFGVAPQAYPPRYTRSGFGGKWSSKLKYAGYDGLVIEGKVESPSILVIEDDNVEIRSGRKYWGLDTIETQKMLQKEFGQDAGLIVIGPAGERLVRIATINSGANNVAGQGGFGAVMGSKNLKAIIIRGSSGIQISDLERLLNLRSECVRLLAADAAKPPEVDVVTTYTTLEWPTSDLREKGDLESVTMGYSPCTGCPLFCRAGGVATQRFFKKVPGVMHPGRVNGAAKCAELGLMGWGSVSDIESEKLKKKTGRDTRFNPGFRAGFETMNLADRYGINAWEFQNMMVWLTDCNMAGVDLSTVMEMPFDENGPVFWQTLLRMITYGEGIGGVLSEGIARAAEQFGKTMRSHAPHAAYGFAHHGLGTYNWSFFPFPYWIPVALMWSSDTRDPMSDTGHKYCMDLALNPEEEQAEKVANEFYGSPHTLAPRPSQIPEGDIPEDLLNLAYLDKEKVTVRNQNRSAVNGSLVLCDSAFPLVLSPVTPDRFGDTGMEAKLLAAVTGLEMDEAALDGLGEAVINLERAISIREGRTTEDDLGVTASLVNAGDWTRGIKLDLQRYKGLLKKYYLERGWDPKTGIPTNQKLQALGLSDVIDDLK